MHALLSESLEKIHPIFHSACGDAFHALWEKWEGWNVSLNRGSSAFSIKSQLLESGGLLFLYVRTKVESIKSILVRWCTDKFAFQGKFYAGNEILGNYFVLTTHDALIYLQIPKREEMAVEKKTSGGTGPSSWMERLLGLPQRNDAPILSLRCERSQVNFFTLRNRKLYFQLLFVFWLYNF